ncbi:NAD(P)-dependent oxidoreductase [Acanthopleuribacter pedis]|uniref:SDR family oxidoreductase n=1 Tax=Acanthopleuribacter pedis TaxID=442870 RepID=A0A8J7QG82_9BACT|nr:SDR family oxidoreductase [Acanthopleuribacter pedis]MBO1321720.1 SDR family oxidoreductase [Acanthopleuribacter pedis]
MNVVVFGATGTVGREIVNQVLARGHRVTAFSRNPQNMAMDHEALSFAQGDVLDPKAVAAAVAGHDAVICALGAGLKGGLRAPGTNNIIAAMQRHNIRRLVCLSTLGVGDSKVHLNFYWKYIMFGMLLRNAFADHVAQETAVQSSDLDWTLIRPSAYTDGPMTGRYQHGFDSTKRRLNLQISRADVAHFTLETLEQQTYIGQTPAVSF